MIHLCLLMYRLFWLNTFVSRSWYASKIVCTRVGQDTLVIVRVLELLSNVLVAKRDVNPYIQLWAGCWGTAVFNYSAVVRQMSSGQLYYLTWHSEMLGRVFIVWHHLQRPGLSRSACPCLAPPAWLNAPLAALKGTHLNVSRWESSWIFQ